MTRVAEVRRDILGLLDLAGIVAKNLAAIEADGRYELGHVPANNGEGTSEANWQLLSDVYDAISGEMENLAYVLGGGGW